MIALSPIFILSVALVILIFLIFYIKLNAKHCMLFTVGSLICALIVSTTIGYQISINSEYVTEIKKQDNPNSVSKQPLKAQATDADSGDNNESNAKKSAPQNAAQAVNPKEADKKKTANLAETAGSQKTQPLNEQGKAAAQALTNASDAAANNEANGTDAVSETELKPEYITLLFACDGYGLLYVSLILIISIVVVCFGYEWFKQEQPRHGFFYVILLFTALGGITLVYASHLLSFYIGIELLSISFVGLIGYQYMQQHSLESAIKYMILSSVASAFLLMGIAFYYAATGELTFSGLSYKFSTLTYPSTLLSMGACLMLVGIGFKISLVPFQLWLPDVYQGTPTPVLLMFSTITKVAIFCAIAKLFLFAPIVNNETLHAILVLMSTTSILWGNLLALKQKNIKRLLAYSSIAHFGYLMTALIAVQYQVLAIETIGVYLISYILAIICLLGVISLESHSVDPTDHENEFDLYGLFWRRPLLALSMSISLLSLAGVPFTSGFISRFMLILLGVTAELWWIITAIVIGSAFGLYFYTRLIIHLFIRPAELKLMETGDNTEWQQETAKARIMRLKMTLRKITISEIIIAVSAFLTILSGIYPKGLFNLVGVAQYLSL